MVEWNGALPCWTYRRERAISGIRTSPPIGLG
jgi:hypothetical protein